MGQPLKSSHRTRGTGARPPPLSLRLSPPTWEQQSCTVLCLRAECLHVRCSYGWVWAGDPGCSKGNWGVAYAAELPPLRVSRQPPRQPHPAQAAAAGLHVTAGLNSDKATRDKGTA